MMTHVEDMNMTSIADEIQSQGQAADYQDLACDCTSQPAFFKQVCGNSIDIISWVFHAYV